MLLQSLLSHYVKIYPSRTVWNCSKRFSFRLVHLVQFKMFTSDQHFIFSSALKRDLQRIWTIYDEVYQNHVTLNYVLHTLFWPTSPVPVLRHSKKGFKNSCRVSTGGFYGGKFCLQAGRNSVAAIAANAKAEECSHWWEMGTRSQLMGVAEDNRAAECVAPAGIIH